MPMGPHPILSSTNTYIAVSNFAGYTGTGPEGTRTIKTADWIPLGTVGGSATGEIIVKASIRESVAPQPPTGGLYSSVVVNATGNGSIPAGVLGWSASVMSGTVTVAGVSVPIGATVGGGGYAGYVADAAIAYTVSGGVLVISYDNIA